MTTNKNGLDGVGLGWRPETAWMIHKNSDMLGFTEVIAESIRRGSTPKPLQQLVDAGMPVIPHGVSLSLGSASKPAQRRLDHLAACAEQLGAPFVSEHIAFVRSAEHETEHLLPIERTENALEILCENILLAQTQLPVPLVLENIASLFEWPESKMDEATFLNRVLLETGCQLLLDLSNLHANATNFGVDPVAFLDSIDSSRIAYVHVAGGTMCNSVYHDTHRHPIPNEVFDLLQHLRRSNAELPVLLERDENFDEPELLVDELDQLFGAPEEIRNVA